MAWYNDRARHYLAAKGIRTKVDPWSYANPFIGNVWVGKKSVKVVTQEKSEIIPDKVVVKPDPFRQGEFTVENVPGITHWRGTIDDFKQMFERQRGRKVNVVLKVDNREIDV